MVLVVGEILFDIFPQGRRLGGAAFNFAYHLHRLNGPLRFLSRIGSDSEGRAIEVFLSGQGFPQKDLQRDAVHPTGRVDVALDAQGSPRFDIIRGVAYDFITSTPSIEHFAAGDCRLVYFGSLIQRTTQGAQTIQRILQHRSPQAKCLFDVNLRPNCYSKEILTSSLHQTDLLKLNQEELDVLVGMHGIQGATDDRVAALMRRFDIEIVALTRAEKGSCLFFRDARHDFVPQDNISIKDTVGAGDAFAAMLAIGYLHGWPADRILTSATRLATAVCGLEGAIPTDPAFYNDFRKMIIAGSRHD